MTKKRNILLGRQKAFLLIALMLALISGVIAPLATTLHPATVRASGYPDDTFISPTSIAIPQNTGANQGKALTLEAKTVRGAATYYFFYSNYAPDGSNHVDYCLDKGDGTTTNKDSTKVANCVEMYVISTNVIQGFIVGLDGTHYQLKEQPLGPITLDYATTFVGSAADAALTKYGQGKVPPLSSAEVTKAYLLLTPCSDGSTRSADGTCPDHSPKKTCESSGFPLAWIICAGINFLDSAVTSIYNNIVQPLLNVKPLETTGPTHTAWSNFRIYGDIFLVIALIVIVFGESIGGGLIDAYTAKKVLPRLLIAAVLINLSYYIVGVLVDAMNILGQGLSNLLSQPFKTDSGFTLNVKGTGSIIDIAGIIALAFAAKAVAGELVAALAVFILLPALFIFLSIMVTVLLRQALIIVLVVVSPVAFALYCLPNTEQYFRKWWDLLFKTLLVYPIIAIVFALGKIMSVVVGTVTDQAAGGTGQVIAPLFTVIALLAPLVMIPYAFKIAGGVIGRAHDTFSTYGKKAHQGILGNPNDHNSLRNRTKTRLGARVADSRKSIYDRGVSNKGTGLGIMGMAQRRIGGKYSADRQAFFNKQARDAADARNNDGDDTYARASTIANSYKDFENSAPDRVQRDAAGRAVKYQAADGKFYSEGEITEGAKRNRTRADWQAAYRRVEEKSDHATPDVQRFLGDDFAAYASAAGLSDKDAGGDLVSATLPNKRRHLGTRHTTMVRDPSGSGQFVAGLNASSLIGDVNGSGGYELAGQAAKTWEDVETAYERTHRSITTGFKVDDLGNVTGTALTASERTSMRHSLDNLEGNLDKFANGSVPPPAAGPGPGGTTAAATAGYGGSTSASHEDSAQAKATLARIAGIKGTPLVKAL